MRCCSRSERCGARTHSLCAVRPLPLQLVGTDMLDTSCLRCPTGQVRACVCVRVRLDKGGSDRVPVCTVASECMCACDQCRAFPSGPAYPWAVLRDAADFGRQRDDVFGVRCEHRTHERCVRSTPCEYSEYPVNTVRTNGACAMQRSRAQHQRSCRSPEALMGGCARAHVPVRARAQVRVCVCVCACMCVCVGARVQQRVGGLTCRARARAYVAPLGCRMRSSAARHPRMC